MGVLELWAGRNRRWGGEVLSSTLVGIGSVTGMLQVLIPGSRGQSFSTILRIFIAENYTYFEQFHTII